MDVTIRIEEFDTPQDTNNGPGGYTAYAVYLGKMFVGKVAGVWSSHMLDYPVRPPGYTYYADLTLPIPMGDGQLSKPYLGSGEMADKQEALDKLLGMVRQWIADAGLVLPEELEQHSRYEWRDD